MLALVARILMRTHVPPRPAVETPVLDVGDVVGDQVVAEIVALVGGAPQLAGLRIQRDAYRIANAVRKYAQARAVRIELQNIGAMKFLWVGVGIVHIRV